MSIEHVPLLKIQRELHDIPRGMDRFQAYLKTMLNDAGDDVRLLPLVIMNPMGREHVTERLDELLALDADTLAADAITEALDELGGAQNTFRHGVVIIDDLRGVGRTARRLMPIFDSAVRHRQNAPGSSPDGGSAKALHLHQSVRPCAHPCAAWFMFKSTEKRKHCVNSWHKKAR